MIAPAAGAVSGDTRRPAGAARTLGVPVLIVLLLGVVLGAIWWVLAPLTRADVVDGQAYLVGHQELQVAQDGWFAVVTGVSGVLAAALVALRSGPRDVSRAVLGPLLGVLVAAVAWRTGVLLGPPPLTDQVAAGSTHPLTPLALHAYGVLLVGPFLFVLTRFMAALFASDHRS